ncbi:hypothetical protein MP638_007026 [Amoeboaphelidium occidentale]|nr:hypothetical protein MP638_007026 [Amoeboaphelidium occidentale]
MPLQKATLQAALRSAFLFFNSQTEDLLEIAQRIIHNLDLSSIGSFSATAASPIQFYDLFQHEMMTCTIFIIRKGHSIPLHNHPQQTVISKLLRGKLRIVSYDLLLSLNGSDCTCRKVADVNIEEEQSMHLVRPTERNLHAVHALETSVFIDFIGPPYDDTMRPISYFRVISKEEGDDYELFRLEQYEPDLHLEHISNFTSASYDYNFVTKNVNSADSQ